MKESYSASRTYIDRKKWANYIRGLQRQEVDGVIRIISLNAVCKLIGINQPSYHNIVRQGFLTSGVINKLADNGIDIRLFEKQDK